MNKLQLFLLFTLLLAAYSCDKDELKQPILVTNVVMPAQGVVFNSGDKVTISAQGFQDTDAIIFDIRWPLPDQPAMNYEGYARGVKGVITERTATSIIFLAPGHYPASKVEVLLMRSGEMMTLGKISVADGQSPKEPRLYGITNSHSDLGNVKSIDRIGMKVGQEIVEVTRLEGSLMDFSCVVNEAETNRICGIYTKGGQRNLAIYDLSMNYWKQEDYHQSLVTMGGLINGGVLAIYNRGTQLYLQTFSVGFSRMNNTSSTNPLFELPAGMKVEALTRYPCVQVTDGYILLSADNGDGTFSPVVLDGVNRIMKAFEPIEATALIPFWIVASVEGQSGKYKRIGGYAISKSEGGTELCLWNSATMALDEPFTTFPNKARSMTIPVFDNAKTQKLYVLFDTNRGGRLIYSYDVQTKEWKPMPGIDYPYLEIVLAR